MAAKTYGKGTITERNLKIELKKNIEGLTDSDITGNEKYGWQIKIPNEFKAFAVSNTGETNEAYWEEIKDANGDVTEIKRVDGKVSGLKIGDTINYIATDGLDTTDDTQMQISSSQTTNGYEDQIIDLRNYDGTWKLLGIENGRLKIISSKIAGVPKTDGDGTSNGVYTNSYFKLYGRTGYTNAETELNRICSIYGKEKYAEPGTARSINVEDINKITGYNPAYTGVNVNKASAEEISAGEPCLKGYLFQYGNRVTYEWDGTAESPDKPKFSSSIQNGQLSYTHNWSGFRGFSWWDGNSSQKSDYAVGKSGKICELTSDYYYYYPETLTTVNDTTKSVGIANNSQERDMLFGTETDYYWLASKCVQTSEFHIGYYIFEMHYCSVYSDYVTTSRGGETGFGFGLRPVVSLKSDIKLEKDGNGVWQFLE